ncbi:MFS transporter, MHS family, shikimate and dehydroshikimate transport protein [Enhydrobacter aerosaccus]|uniref:MFS transporter, MHS family, shikimate and dehydroshikimate transport protein n=1 Tax=Enhydrobacter aerosaccus TaxID=225324 RepID=A0A1T4L9G3_9HYPH|nr:MFS transporter [Enhydrobacter aerosaccus]SJZ51211.1 MFS transporter, MHS family, shikimate and dehydroshikimate transport protein [Enhydrobacter aerosaccus]
MTSTAVIGSSASPKNMGIIAFAGTFGTIIEWYDFLIYGTAAALVFNKLFFPTVDPLTGTLAALATYAVGFVARPVGGALFGHFGDRIGRKSMLMLTMAIMGLGTFLVGLLPTYDQIGIFAPALLVLLRFVQGLAMGGEWGGASLMVLEHAPAGKRGFYGSLVQVGFSLGLVTSSGVFALATAMPESSFLAWGWRLPFLVSIVLVLLGAFIRARVPETPVFEDLKARNDISTNPFVEAVFKNPRSFLVALGLKLSEVSWVYMLTVFVVGYATSKLALPRKLLLDAIFWAALVEVVTIPLFGWLSDRIGRRPFYFLGVLFTVLFAFPLFWMLDTKDPAIVMLAIIVGLNLGHGLMFAPESAYFPELFGARVRFTGASFGFQASAAIGGGFAPIIATWLAAYMGGTAGVSIMLILLAALTFVATLFARETKDVSLLE